MTTVEVHCYVLIHVMYWIDIMREKMGQYFRMDIMSSTIVFYSWLVQFSQYQLMKVHIDRNVLVDYNAEIKLMNYFWTATTVYFSA